MRHLPPPPRAIASDFLTCLATSMLCICGLLLPAGGYAQSAPGDPPARVGRLAELRGAVMLRTADTDAWSRALANYPVTSGLSVQVPPGGRAELQVDADRFAVPSASELHVTRLDDSEFAATLPQGEVCFALATVPPGRSYGVQTPRGLVEIASGGRYAVVAGDTDHPTVVSVIAGAAAVSATGVALQLDAGQAARITGPGVDQASGSVIAAAPDECLSALIAEEQAPARTAAAPAAVMQMTGGEELVGYGTWQAAPGYASVWFPQVAAGWAPYRRGRWVDVAPWGWTWCDDAPWGFAPFHYGRWARFHDRWGWVPGEATGGPPVYAPALVAFFGIGGAGIALGGGAPAGPDGGDIGWVPLAPHDAYYPWYHTSPSYVRDINRRHVADLNEVVNNYTHDTYNGVVVNRYANAAAATVVSAAVVAASRPVAALARPVAPAQLAAARPVMGEHAVLGSHAALRPQAPEGAGSGHSAPAPASATVSVARPGQVPRLPPAGAIGALHRAAAPLLPARGLAEETHPAQAAPLPVPRPEATDPATVARPPPAAPAASRPAELTRPHVAQPEPARPTEVARPPAAVPDTSRPAEPARPHVAQPEPARPAEVARPVLPRPEASHEATAARPPPPVVRAEEQRPQTPRPAQPHPQEERRKLPDQP